MDLGRVMAIGRWGVILGVLVVQGGFFFERPLLSWGGVAVVVLALAVNTGGKFASYLGLDITIERRLTVMAGWLFLVATIAGLVFDYAYAGLTDGYEGNFWALVVATAGFAAVYTGLRRKYVPYESGDDE